MKNIQVLGLASPFGLVVVFGITLQSVALRSQEFVVSPEIPHDVTEQKRPFPEVSLEDLALFAWKEFVALNYPADPNHRGQAKPGSSLGDPAEARVWETYWHRVEMFPYDENPARNGVAPVVTGYPTYKFDPSAFTYESSYGSDGVAPDPQSVWNNLDENNELNVDKMFAHLSEDMGGFTNENRVLYEAKMNEAGFAYILEKELYKSEIRDRFAKASSTPMALARYGSQSSVDADNIVSLPAGTQSGSEGNIEIKGAWRRVTDEEIANGNIYTNSVIRYENVNAERKWFKETYGLVGLHIIHKTVNFPSFVYATFEHKGNLDSGIGYIDEITQTGRGVDEAGNKVYIKERDNPIPKEVIAVNQEVSSSIAGTVWENYELVGVQAYPVDFAKLGDSISEKSSYYLANLVIESNEELQNFRGKKAGALKDADNMFVDGRSINMGGCMGCHGVAQLRGADFNFLIANSPFRAPEIVGDSGTISLRPIKNYSDAQKMLDDFVKLNGINIKPSPHGAFWRELTYEEFLTRAVPGVAGNIEILTPGNAEESAIIEILKGQFRSLPRMPEGGPYFPEEQIDEFAKWIDAGCPNFPMPPFSEEKYPMRPVIANSYEQWAKGVLGVSTWEPRGDGQGGGTFDVAAQAVHSTDPSSTPGLLTVLVSGPTEAVDVISYICVGGPGASDVDVAVYPPSESGLSSAGKYLGWNGDQFAEGPAVETDGYYWYRLDLKWSEPFKDPNSVFYAKTYRAEDGQAREFTLWAFTGGF